MEMAKKKVKTVKGKTVKQSEHNGTPAAHSGDSCDLAIQRAVECRILELDGEHYRFTAIFQQCMLSALPAVSQDIQDPAHLGDAIGRAETLAIILFAGPDLTLPEIDALLQVVEVVMQAGRELAFPS